MLDPFKQNCLTLFFDNKHLLQLFKLSTFALLIITLLLSAHAQSTGSRIKSNVKTMPREIIWIDGSREINEIRHLLQRGDKQAALTKTEMFLQQELPPELRYSGLNALCITQTIIGNEKSAIRACNQAIEIQPNNWKAFNSRGTAYYTAKRFNKAISDYQKALQLNPESEISKYNLELSRGKINQLKMQNG